MSWKTPSQVNKKLYVEGGGHSIVAYLGKMNYAEVTWRKSGGWQNLGGGVVVPLAFIEVPNVRVKQTCSSCGRSHFVKASNI